MISVSDKQPQQEQPEQLLNISKWRYEHHLVWIAAKVAGLEVPQGLVPKVVAAEILPVVQWEVCRQGSGLDHHLAQSTLGQT